MKVLFAIHQLSFADHIAIAYLSAIAKQLGHSTYFCVFENCDFAEKVARIGPDVVAYSANIMGFEQAVENNKRAKQRHNFISIMGGPQVTFEPETFEQSGMDVYCLGEGEGAFRDFLIQVENGESYDDVPNLITRENKNPVRPLIRNLDELPPADRDLVLSNSFLKDVPKKTFYATRGCPFKCAYCCNNYYHQLYRGKGPIVRRFSVERVIQEIESVKGMYRMDFVKFGDDLFAMKADAWLEEFAEKYSTRVGIPFNCYLRLDIVDDELLGLLRKAGCFSVHLSLDSTSKNVREKVLRRQMREVNVVENLRRIKKHGINTWVNYMLAVPESSLQDDLDTIEVSKKGKVTYPHYTTAVPMKGTELYDYCARKNFLDVSSYQGDMTGCSEKSVLSCFSERDKNIRHNIYSLGAVIAKLPFPLDKIAVSMIKRVPPNDIFKSIRSRTYDYYIANKIFKLPKVS